MQAFAIVEAGGLVLQVIAAPNVDDPAAFASMLGISQTLVPCGAASVAIGDSYVDGAFVPAPAPTYALDALTIWSETE